MIHGKHTYRSRVFWGIIGAILVIIAGGSIYSYLTRNITEEPIAQVTSYIDPDTEELNAQKERLETAMREHKGVLCCHSKYPSDEYLSKETGEFIAVNPETGEISGISTNWEPCSKALYVISYLDNNNNKKAGTVFIVYFDNEISWGDEIYYRIKDENGNTVNWSRFNRCHDSTIETKLVTPTPIPEFPYESQVKDYIGGT